jgi:hypothetical protein
LGGWRYVEREGQEAASLATEGAKGFSRAERLIKDSFQLRLWLLKIDVADITALMKRLWRYEYWNATFSFSIFWYLLSICLSPALLTYRFKAL